MNVPKSITFTFGEETVYAEMKYSLPEGWNGTTGATFSLKFADYDSVGSCLQDLLREMGIHAHRVDDRWEAEAKRLFLQGAI
jgi:hypothetical protein